ncbi:MAG: hypothetical protein HY226_06170, partial [Candidatus Vogelbacteria bacterium]|nr:hypothetical protein [Candidatus Vogelbacteria bacterium]
MQNWILNKELSQDERKGLSSHNDLLAHLLFHRGVKDEDAAERFLKPNFERDLHDPFLVLNMEKAVERILLA